MNGFMNVIGFSLSGRPDLMTMLDYPLMASPRYSGVRVRKIDGEIQTDAGTAVPSSKVQEDFRDATNGVEFVITSGDPLDEDVKRKTENSVMNDDRGGLLTYHLYDIKTEDPVPYWERRRRLFGMERSENMLIVTHQNVWGDEALLWYFNRQIRVGHKGIVVRKANGMYRAVDGIPADPKDKTNQFVEIMA